MNEISEFFAANGINPFIAGLILGAMIWAIPRSKATISAVDPHSKEMKAKFSTGMGSVKTFTEIAQVDNLNIKISTGDGPKELSPGETKEIVDALKKGDKINAIKVVRNATGLNLKNSKDLVEALERTIV